MFNFCPSCASKSITFNEGKVFRCPDCGFTYFHNIAAATGCLISVPEQEGQRLVFTVRGKEPGKGLMDMPGGFIDPGEGALEGLSRELREELDWTPPGKNLADIFRLYASFPNVYFFKGVNYNTCDLYFFISAPGLKRKDFHPDPDEIADVLFLKPEEIDLSCFAFESTKKAVKTYLDNMNYTFYN
jgi:NADH pyrophosphatase NudC (nudix superfamily)